MMEWWCADTSVAIRERWRAFSDSRQRTLDDDSVLRAAAGRISTTSGAVSDKVATFIHCSLGGLGIG